MDAVVGGGGVPEVHGHCHEDVLHARVRHVAVVSRLSPADGGETPHSHIGGAVSRKLGEEREQMVHCTNELCSVHVCAGRASEVLHTNI